MLTIARAMATRSCSLPESGWEAGGATGAGQFLKADPESQKRLHSDRNNNQNYVDAPAVHGYFTVYQNLA